VTASLVLDDVVVIDATTGLAGPVATSWLADLGADVVKIEPPTGDPVRSDEPGAFATWNRGKRSVVLDLGLGADRGALEQLLWSADVFVHEWTASEAEALGFGDAALATRQPSLIVASVSGYPYGHPDEGRPGHEILVQARIGAMDELEARRPGPMFVRYPFANWGAAHLLVGGIAARLHQRARTGEARALHTSIFQGAMTVASLYWQRAERPPTWMATHTLPKLNNPGQLSIFECADGRWLQLLGAFTRSGPVADLLEKQGAPELLGAWVTAETRDRFVEIFRARTLDEWTDLLWAEDVVCMPVLDVGQVLQTEQARANGYTVTVDDPELGTTTQAAAPFEVGASRQPCRPGAPQLGADTKAAVARNDLSDRTRMAAAPDWANAGDAFSGVRILDFGSYVAGPYGGQCFADFGADVIKIEAPGGEKGREINQFSACHRGKRDLALDLRHPGAKAVLHRLFRSADVVMHNVRETASVKLGIDEASVRAANPTIVYAHSSAYGLAGPWAEFGGFDPTAFALSGWAREISPAGMPTWFRPSAMDCHTGIALFTAAALGLYERERSGVGPKVATSLLAVAIASAGETLVTADGSFAPFRHVDAAQTGVSAFYRTYEAPDGWFAVAARTTEERAALVAILGETADDALGPDLREQRADDVARALEEAGVPVERVALDHRDRFFDAELARNSRLVERTVTKDYGWFESLGAYWSDSHEPIRHPGPLPAVGEHSRAILRELGYRDEDIDDLVAEGVVVEAPAIP
jgi:crotonobetainyl-CoA:carnitine CoA-transferase CaiB-like acyl-CoA transferase